MRKPRVTEERIVAILAEQGRGAACGGGLPAARDRRHDALQVEGPVRRHGRLGRAAARGPRGRERAADRACRPTRCSTTRCLRTRLGKEPRAPSARRAAALRAISRRSSVGSGAFVGRLSVECLDACWGLAMADARERIDEWKERCNAELAHGPGRVDPAASAQEAEPARRIAWHPEPIRGLVRSRPQPSFRMGSHSAGRPMRRLNRAHRAGRFASPSALRSSGTGGSPRIEPSRAALRPCGRKILHGPSPAGPNRPETKPWRNA